MAHAVSASLLFWQKKLIVTCFHKKAPPFPSFELLERDEKTQNENLTTRGVIDKTDCLVVIYMHLNSESSSYTGIKL